ncbi:MAG: histidine--tRNA ligase [Bdellovibrio sp.]
MLSKTPYRGTRDFFPAEKRIQDYMFSMMRKTAQSFGYESYDGPMLEEVELYKAKSGEELINDQIYSFKDRGERFVAIRPEMTPTLARMIAQIYREYPKPIRWFSIPNLMRYEKPQKGRLREHWQFNCDIFAGNGRLGEVEILQIAATLLENFGANESHFEILINDRAIVDCVFNELMSVTKEEAYRLYKIVDRSKKVSREALEKMVDEVQLSSSSKEIFYKYLDLKTFDDVHEFLKAHGKSEISNTLAILTNLLEETDLARYVTYDPTIVRGLDYYTGVVFEIFDKNPENRRAICGGGAYANLLQIFNEDPLPGVGFGLGDVTLKDFLETHRLLPDLKVNDVDLILSFQTEEARKSIWNISKELRKRDLKVINLFEIIKFKKLFPLAEKKGARFVAIIGEDELKKGQILIKNLETKDQQTFALNDFEAMGQFCRKG